MPPVASHAKTELIDTQLYCYCRLRVFVAHVGTLSGRIYNFKQQNQGSTTLTYYSHTVGLYAKEDKKIDWT